MKKISTLQKLAISLLAIANLFGSPARSQESMVEVVNYTLNYLSENKMPRVATYMFFNPQT
jgi:queuine/archaeosine tRNA-ribosyltransferase